MMKVGGSVGFSVGLLTGLQSMEEQCGSSEMEERTELERWTSSRGRSAYLCGSGAVVCGMLSMSLYGGNALESILSGRKAS